MAFTIDPSKIDPLKATRFVLSTVVSFGATTIVKKFIEANVTPTSTVDKVTVPVASIALGAMLGDYVGEYVEEQFDKTVATVKSLQDSQAE